MQRSPNRREREQCHRVQHKNSSERDGDLFLAGIGDWGDRGNRAAAADGRTGRNEEGDSLLHVQKSSQPPTQEQCETDAGRGIDKPGAAAA